MMKREDIIARLYSKEATAMDFMFDSLMGPPIPSMFLQQDIERLYNIASSLKLNAKIDEKYKALDKIMYSRGFKRYHAGTNRLVYKCLDDVSIVAKVAVDRRGLTDNPAEFMNQAVLKPFVTKTFDCSANGELVIAERVRPIMSLTEFLLIAPDIYNIIVNKFIGKYVIEDFGSDYFMNWGVRAGFGPCLLDYPYVYELDVTKLVCNKPIFPNTKAPVCGGEVDYDNGFNNLICPICGKHFLATELKMDLANKILIIKGETEMANAIVKVYRGDKLIVDTSVNRETKTIVKNNYRNKKEVYRRPAQITISRKDTAVKDALNKAGIIVSDDEAHTYKIMGDIIRKEQAKHPGEPMSNTRIADLTDSQMDSKVYDDKTHIIYNADTSAKFTEALNATKAEQNTDAFAGATFMGGVCLNPEYCDNIVSATILEKDSDKIEKILKNNFASNEVKEEVDLSKLKNFKPALSDTTVENVVEINQEPEEVVKTEDIKETHKEFFGKLEERLNYVLDSCISNPLAVKDEDAIYEVLIQNVIEFSKNEDWFNISPDVYVNSYMHQEKRLTTPKTVSKVLQNY